MFVFRSLTKGRKLALLAVLLFLVSFISLTWVQFRQYHQLSEAVNGIDYQSRWTYVSLNVEYHRLARALDQQLDARRSPAPETLRLRYDVFVSHVNQIKGGSYRDALETDPSHQRALADLSAFVHEADHYLGPDVSQALDTAALRKLSAQLDALREPLHDMLVLTNQHNGDTVDLMRADVRQQIIYNMVLTTLQSLLAVGLVLAVVYQTRRRMQSQTALALAQSNVLSNFERHERELEQRIALRTAELEVANQELAALSVTDSMTGIANRRRFDTALAEEWRRATRTGQPLALAMVDVDWFKRYNDHYGHQKGDDCLRQVARLLDAHLRRSGDVAARYGGEEFAFIAPNTDAPTAVGMAESFSRALVTMGIAHEVSQFGCVTVSIGIAVVLPTDAQTPEFLLAQADQALYQAKDAGRNRVVLAS